MRNYGQTQFALDLETFVENSSYCKRYDNNKTDIYAIAIQRIPVYWTSKTEWTNREWKKGTQWDLRLYGRFEDVWTFLNNPKEHGSKLLVWIHNGQKFDYWYFKAWLEHSDFAFACKERDIDTVNLQYEYQGRNVWFWTTSPSWTTLEVWLWNEEYHQHVMVEFRDSIRLISSSIANWYHDFLALPNGAFVEDLYKDRWAWTPNDRYHPTYYSLIDLEKKPLDIHYVDDKKGTTCYCADGTSYDILDVNKWPDMIRERVGNDVRIMVFCIKYFLFHHAINTPKTSRICVTSAQYSIRSYVHDKLLKEEFRQQVSQHGKVDDALLWDNIFGCSLKERQDLIVPMHPYHNGGICTLNPNFVDKIIKGDFISLDVNSEYPFVATQPLPIGLPTIQKTIPSDPDVYYFVSFKFKSITQKLTNATPVIPCKWANDYLDKQNELDYKYTYKLGKGEAHVGMEEFKNFTNNAWFRISGMEITNVYVFHTNPWLRDFMQTNNEIKIHSTGIVRANAKLKSNSFTGKLSQNYFQEATLDPAWLVAHGITKEQILKVYGADYNNERLSHLDEAIEKHQHLTVLTEQDSSFAYLPAYCCITAKGRAWLVSHMMEICQTFKEATCLYNDTDSIKFKVHDRAIVMDWLTKNQWLDDTALGKFKEEFGGKVKSFKLLCPKKYLGADANCVIIMKYIARSGFKKEIFENKKLSDFHLNMYLPHQTTRKVEGGVLIHDGVAKLNKPTRYD